MIDVSPVHEIELEPKFRYVHASMDAFSRYIYEVQQAAKTLVIGPDFELDSLHILPSLQYTK